MKKYKRGMVLGKFMPLHKGHMFLINTAIDNSEHVDIFLCSLENEPIPGKVRYEWMQKVYGGRKDVTIHWVQDENPQNPSESESFEEFYKIWCSTVYSRTSDLDGIFTSETYGDEFAHELGIEHHLVDIDRGIYPVSGTEVRNNAIEYWNLIPKAVQRYYKKSIVVMGPESTGKSILVKQLADYYGGDLVEEYGREFTDENIVKSMTIKDFETIAIEHDRRIEYMLDNGDSPYIFIDTEAITTYSFGKLYLGNKFNSDIIAEIAYNQKFDLTLLCNIDVPWIDDGTRDFPDKREWHFNAYKEMLDDEEYPSNYVIINGDYSVRLDQAVDVVDELIDVKFV